MCWNPHLKTVIFLQKEAGSGRSSNIDIHSQKILNEQEKKVGHSSINMYR